MHAKASPHPISAWNGHHYCVERASLLRGTGILPVIIFRCNGHIARYNFPVERAYCPL
ncbi:hypothetical protein [Moorena producens]|uniref:hypothetical protein n=1 Tax=Moorena producens TaxID=1155739 RepID=UPI001314465C|nr:hypothetical protein [Moorena producens]